MQPELDPLTSTDVDVLLRQATSRLSAAGVDTPANDAKLLLASAVQVSPAEVEKAKLLGRSLTQLLASSGALAGHDETAEINLDLSAAHVSEILDHFNTMLLRRQSREPLQHITGHAPFRYLDLQVGRGVFIPRPETELVVQSALDWIAEQQLTAARVVDLCAGSGAIGLAVATELPHAHVWAVEMDSTAASWTARNRDALAEQYSDLMQRYELQQADATNVLTLAALDNTVDVVISNPPYIPETDIPEQEEVREYDPNLALYGGSADGMMIPERIISRAWSLLRPGGLLVMEHDVTQPVRTRTYATACGFIQATTHNDLTGRPRFLTAIKPR
ncbi:peptide chain release factor N(5)-glutamine methyltransferase [Bifidobacterium dolichotidis]|nr:peptide chain release factor N(5)-glutamine methyltransferase [Bifidobacterium dolichotidis]